MLGVTALSDPAAMDVAPRRSRRYTVKPAPPLRLADHHRAILGALDEVEAWRTGDVAYRAGFVIADRGNARRVASASCRLWLLELQDAGLVEHLGDCNPMTWRRTADGTAMLGLLRRGRRRP